MLLCEIILVFQPHIPQICSLPFFRAPLHAAAFTDHVECLQLLLSHNAQVNSVDSTGKTPLMMAAENGQTNTVGKYEVACIS